jgi:hypothetical protein
VCDCPWDAHNVYALYLVLKVECDKIHVTIFIWKLQTNKHNFTNIVPEFLHYS